jgi:hypothetical protein
VQSRDELSQCPNEVVSALTKLVRSQRKPVQRLNKLVLALQNDPRRRSRKEGGHAGQSAESVGSPGASVRYYR